MYFNSDIISFTDIYGKSWPVRTMREYPNYILLDSIVPQKENRIDEIATRKQFYGDDAEGESYKIVEFNVERLFENYFDVSKLKVLEIPVR